MESAAESESARELTLDLFVEGEPVRRDAPVRLAPEGLRIGEREFPYESLFWVSRRAGLLLLFGREATVALKGAGGDLEELSRAVERRSDRSAQRRLLQPMAREVVVCTAGTAVTGTVGRRRVRGLHLAVFTQCGLHLLGRDRHHTLMWPVDAVERVPSAAHEERQALRLRKGEETELLLRYLFAEEIRAVERVAGRAPRVTARAVGAASETEDPRDSDADRPRPMELFARGEVAPPPPVRLPEFTVSVERLRELAARAVDRATGPAGPRPLEADVLELHFQELGETALGPLMLRRSAAAGARSLERAVEAIEAGQLQQDTRAAFAAAVERVGAAYEEELGRRLAGKRVRSEPDPGLVLEAGERERLRERVEKTLQPLNPLFLRLFKRQELLRRRLRALESGPPEAGEEELDAAAEAWRDDLRRLDRALGSAWSGLLQDLAVFWSDRLLPRLREAERLPDRAGWGGLWLAAAATAVAILSAVTVYLLAR